VYRDPPRPITVDSPNVQYTDGHVEAHYSYETTDVILGHHGPEITCKPRSTKVVFRTERKPRKTGVCLVGWGGNNGTTVTAGIIANRKQLKWRTKEKEHTADYFGSVTQSSTVRLGTDPATGNDIHVLMKKLVPLLEPNDLVIGGWDISSRHLGDAMRRAQVLDVQLQDQVYDEMSKMMPWPAPYFPDFIAANQADRADNVLKGSKMEQLNVLRQNIKDFKAKNHLEQCIILWTANTVCIPFVWFIYVWW